MEALEKVTKASKGLDMVTVVGLPLGVDGRLYNCAALVCGGALLGVVPKRNPPNYGEFYELRHFTPAAQARQGLKKEGENKRNFGLAKEVKSMIQLLTSKAQRGRRQNHS